MASPQVVYQQKVTYYQNALAQVKRKLFASSMLRLFVFIATVLAIYFCWNHTKWVIVIVLAGLILFFYLVSRHVNLQQKRRKFQALLQLNQTEIAVLNGQYANLPEGKQYQDAMHEFSRDIDLFGAHSFFQYLNRTALKESEQQLATILTANDTTNIAHKQEAIKDLAKQLDFRQTFTALAQLASKENEEDKTVKSRLDNLKTHGYFTLKRTQLFAYSFSIISLLLIITYFLDFIPGFAVVLWFFIGIAITGIYLKRVNMLEERVNDMQLVFQQYHQLLKLIEDATFTSQLLQDKQTQITTHSKKASVITKEFSSIIGALDQRENMLFGFLGNGFLLWDIHQSARLEKWMRTYLHKVEDWFNIIVLIDAYNSMGNFTFNHPHYTFPKITTNNTLIEAQQAVHPLIPEQEAITNDFTISKEDFFIITGANMAGKSTFLRTVALQIVMSNVGLPVRASHCSYTPTKLITSMRTVDSLADESSYFYAELSRLKYIIDHLKEDNYFIVLDEILKGTNSKDKAIGSRKFLEKLVASLATGIIATHDLSLCDVAQHLPQVKNHFFDAQILNDELYFDYKFKEGICQNMNASFLLRKMKIVDE